MTVRAVHWHEGVFLHPHHFQAEHRYHRHQHRLFGSWVNHHVWGLRSFELDADALRNSRFVVRSLRAIFRDGTPVAVPADAPLPAIDLKSAFTPGQPLAIYLALPVLNLGQSNVSTQPGENATRYRVTVQEWEDENSGVNPQPIQVRVPNLRLLVGDQDQTGYETVPLCRLEKAATANAPPQLDTSFIPPVLACDAWPPLLGDILQALFDRIGRKRQRLAEQLAARGVTVGSPDPNDVIAFAHLRELNEAYAVLSVVAFSPGISPLAAYSELCRLIGQLVIFDRSGRWPAIPPYDHDDLGGCFHRAKTYLDSLLDILPEPEYKERPFVGLGARLQVAVEPLWLDPAWELFIGVRSEADPDEAVRLLTVPGLLDLKVGAGERVDALFQMGQAGLSFTTCSRPQVLPDHAGMRYLRVAKLPEREWGHVVRSLTLAARINETRLLGGLTGERVIRVRTPTGPHAMTFTLYAIPSGDPRA